MFLYFQYENVIGKYGLHPVISMKLLIMGFECLLVRWWVLAKENPVSTPSLAVARRIFIVTRWDFQTIPY